jgi:hypothetical protein
MKNVIAMLMLAAVCYSEDDLKRYWCKVSCYRGGWDSGTYANGRCLCIDYVQPGEFVETQLVSSPKVKKGRIFYGE